MAAITAAELTYTPVSRFVTEPGRVRRILTLAFPTGANAGTNNAYTAGGIALDKAALGCPRALQRLLVIGRTPVAGNNNPRWEWNGDTVSPKLVGLGNGAAGAPDAELAGTVTFATAQTLTIEAEGW
jgi:hypothetical protein